MTIDTCLPSDWAYKKTHPNKPNQLFLGAAAKSSLTLYYFYNKQVCCSRVLFMHRPSTCNSASAVGTTTTAPTATLQRNRCPPNVSKSLTLWDPQHQPQRRRRLSLDNSCLDAPVKAFHQHLSTNGEYHNEDYDCCDEFSEKSSSHHHNHCNRELFRGLSSVHSSSTDNDDGSGDMSSDAMDVDEATTHSKRPLHHRRRRLSLNNRTAVNPTFLISTTMVRRNRTDLDLDCHDYSDYYRSSSCYKNNNNNTKHGTNNNKASLSATPTTIEDSWHSQSVVSMTTTTSSVGTSMHLISSGESGSQSPTTLPNHHHNNKSSSSSYRRHQYDSDSDSSSSFDSDEDSFCHASVGEPANRDYMRKDLGASCYFWGSDHHQDDLNNATTNYNTTHNNPDDDVMDDLNVGARAMAVGTTASANAAPMMNNGIFSS